MTTVNVNVAEARPEPISKAEARAMFKALVERRRAEGRKLCPRCDGLAEGEEDGVLFRRLCWSCDAMKTERLIRRLVRRLGPKGARKALKGLCNAK